MLSLLPYHQKVLTHFKQQPKTWEFFAAAKTREDQLHQYKTSLLKNTYKFSPDTDQKLFQAVHTAKEKLGLNTLSVSIYQAQYTDEINASIIYLESEAHIVFSGQILNLLNDHELLAVIAHELTHIKLYTAVSGDAEVADRIVTAIANSPDSEPSYYETARLFRLYTEIYCDRGAYLVCGDPAPAITSLVKVATGLHEVNADNYCKQAEEIFALDHNTRTQTVSHPENFIRARSLQLWHNQKESAEPAIIKMIEGVTEIDQLDIFKQRELADLTLEILHLYLKPKWFRTTLVMSQAKQYFSTFASNEKIVLTNTLLNNLEQAHESVKEYFSYLLLDFALIDPALEDVPFGWAFQFAEDIYLKEAFDSVVKKEMKFSDKKLQQHKKKTLDAFSAVKEGEGEQIYEG